jgi:hypothetical protein
MSNPFQRQGKSFRSGDWKAWSIGLLAQLAAETLDAPKLTYALIGDIGSGKTTALESYRQRVQAVRPNDVFLVHDIGPMDIDKVHTLHRLVYAELAGKLGDAAVDEAAKELNLRTSLPEPHLSAHDIYALIRAMVRRSENAGRRVHLLVDECQRPAEHFESTGDTQKLRSWFEQLKSLAEAMALDGGCMVITITTIPWENAPRHARDRFVKLRASPPDTKEIQAFIDEGMKHAGQDKPTKANRGLGAAIRAKHPTLITIRELHGLCYDAWHNANKAGAKILGADHLP